MDLEHTVFIGDGNIDAVIDDVLKTIKWKRPMFQGLHASLLTKVVNITQGVNLPIVSNDLDSDGFIIQTNYSGDASTWGSDGLGLSIDDNLPGQLIANSNLATTSVLDNTETVWTPRITFGERFEKISIAIHIQLASSDNISGWEWHPDEVNSWMEFSSNLSTGALVQINNHPNLVMRNMHIRLPGQSYKAIFWRNNGTNEHTATLENCKFSGGSGSQGVIRLFSEGAKKNLVIDNCTFAYPGVNGNSTNAIISDVGTFGHTYTFRHCTLARCGNLASFVTNNSGAVVTYESCFIFSGRLNAGAGAGEATMTFTNCQGNSALAAGITEKSEREAFFAYHKAPVPITNYPDDWSVIDDVAASGKLAVTRLSAVLRTQRGTLRSDPTDTGPDEAFVGFGIPVTIPAAPILD